jgi:hypothetical protein
MTDLERKQRHLIMSMEQLREISKTKFGIIGSGRHLNHKLSESDRKWYVPLTNGP